MGNSDIKTKRNKTQDVTKTSTKKKMVTEEDIRKRAFELSQQNGVSHHSEIDNWLRAERELRGAVN